jgi:hypothetical protein
MHATSHETYATLERRLARLEHEVSLLTAEVRRHAAELALLERRRDPARRWAPAGASRSGPGGDPPEAFLG